MAGVKARFPVCAPVSLRNAGQEFSALLPDRFSLLLLPGTRAREAFHPCFLGKMACPSLRAHKGTRAHEDRTPTSPSTVTFCFPHRPSARHSNFIAPATNTERIQRRYPGIDPPYRRNPHGNRQRSLAPIRMSVLHGLRGASGVRLNQSGFEHRITTASPGLSRHRLLANETNSGAIADEFRSAARHVACHETETNNCISLMDSGLADQSDCQFIE
jgi:hypothetical protein